MKLGGIEGGLSSERDWGKEVRLTYDPLWSNSRQLIDYVEDADREDAYTVGQLRVISGSLIAYDLSSLSSIMNSSSMEEYIASGMSDGETSHSRSNKSRHTEKKKEASVIREFLKSLPLGIGFVLVSESAHFWFSVKREYLTLYDLDVPLKFPICISGTWKALGIVDAVPNDHVEGLQSIVERQIDGLMPTMVLNMMQLTGATTALFGRPLAAYGLSPLTVYREVSS